VNELISAFLKEVRGYVPVLASVVAAPRQAIPQRIYERSAPLSDAMTFFGATLALLLILQAPLIGPEYEYIKVAGTLLTVKIVMLMVFNAAVAILFRLAGGRGGFIATLCASLYIVAPVYLFAVTLKLLGLGILAGSHPEFAAALKSGAQSLGQVMQTLADQKSGTAMWLNLLMLFHLVGVSGWYLVCWKVYRQIHHVSRLRSGLIYIAAWLLYAGIVNFDKTMMRGLYGATPPSIF